MKPFIPSKLAEIVFALVVGYYGYLHLKNASGMGSMVPDFMPGDAKIWIYVIGAGFLAAAIAIIFNFQKTLACYLLAAVFVVFIFTIHIKVFDTNPSGVLKDTAMAMGAILIGNRGSK